VYGHRQFFGDFLFFKNICLFSPIFTLFFFEMLFLLLHPLVFPRWNHGKTPRTYTYFTRNSDQQIYACVDSCDDRTSIWKNVFFGVKRGTIVKIAMTWKQSIKRPVTHPNSMKMRKSSDWNSELRVARGS